MDDQVQKSLHPLCLTVTLYFCLHSSCPSFFNACPFLSIPLCIISFSQVPCESQPHGDWKAFFGGEGFKFVRMCLPDGKKRQSSNIITASDIIKNITLLGSRYIISSQTAVEEGKLSTSSEILGNVKSREQTDPLYPDHSFPGGCQDTSFCL